MAAYRLIALDMDGTLLDDEQRVSDENRRWIAQARREGIAVCLATGRGIRGLMPYAEDLGLDGPIVAVNGSEVWRRPHELHIRHTIDPSLIRRLHYLAERHESWYWAYAVDEVFNRDNWPEQLENHQWLKFGYYTEDDRVRELLRSEIASWDAFEITNSHPCNLELNPKGVSKASGLRVVCEMLGIRIAEVVAVGDSLNDMEMIREAGLGVAMGNAQEAVKAAADAVTLANTEDGVAYMIREFVLK